MAQVYNPFLPLNEYIPDGEPHVFGDRVYLFGSHDQEGGDSFCLLDYVVWSAPVDDLSKWTNTGVTYSAKQDPLYEENTRCSLYAPDVVQGNDGRFYLYYCLSGFRGRGGHSNPISVAVSDAPDGKYEYLGVVRDQSGKPYMRYVCFDPAVINDDGVIRLYYGTCIPLDDYSNVLTRRLFAKLQARLFDRTVEEILSYPDGVMGAIVVTLADDMLTVIEEGKRVIPTRTKKTEFDGHSFFEGSSIRKIGDTYYFIYSSNLNHELCYATSKYPDRNFKYGGTIISTGDVGLDGRKEKDRLNHTGTTHGSIECLNGQWYVFYHRLTHSSGYSRQACAEKISIERSGKIRQVPVTSCGLNQGPLKAEGSYPAAIACVLTDGKMEHSGNGFTKKPHPNHSHQGEEHFITGITDNTLIGFRYFAFHGRQRFEVQTRGAGIGELLISTELNGEPVGKIAVGASSEWHTDNAEIDFPDGTTALYLRYRGKGSKELLSIAFVKLR